MKITAENGKVFKVKDTEYYVGKTAPIGGKLIVANGKVLDEPIILTQEILEEVPAKPFVPLPDDEEEE